MARDLKLEVLLSAVDKITGPLKRITQGSGAMARAMKEGRDQLKQLQAQQKDISSFRTLKAASQQTEGALAASQAKVRDLAREMAASSAPTRKLAAEFRRAQREAQALKQKHGEQQRELQGLRGRLSEAGISTRKLSTHERELRQKIVQTNESISQQGSRMQRLTEQTKRLAKAQQAYRKTQEMAGNMAIGGAAAMANSYALSRPLAASVAAFAPAEDAATQLKVSLMDAGGQVSADFARISELAKSLGDRLPGTTAQFTEMLTMLLKQGISAKSVLGGTGEAAAYLGVQLKLPAEQAAEFAANMQDATGTVESDMMGLMDMIQKTANLGVKTDDIIQGFSKMSPAMTLVGEKGLKTSQALAPLLAMMTQTGMAGESAGNAIRKVFQAGLDLDKVTKANKGLKQLGINLDFTDGKGDFGGLDKLFGQLEKLKSLNDTAFTDTVKEIFGDDAETLQVVKTMMDKGLAGYNEVAGKMQAQADLRKRVNEQLATLTNVMDAASGSWTNAQAEFGAAVAPQLKEIIQDVGALANRIGAWARENPKLAGALVKVSAGIAAVSAAGGALAIGLAGLLGPFAMVKLAMVTFGIASGVALGPILLVIAAVAALTAGAYLLWKNWDSLGPKFAALWEGIKQAFAKGLNAIKGLANRLPAPIRRLLGLDSAASGIASAAKAAMPAMASDKPIRVDSRPPLVTPLAQGAQNVNLGGVAVNVHAAPGMDETAIGRAVAAELERITRQQQARGRSRLTDLE